MSATLSAESLPMLKRFRSDRILGVALLVSLAVHALVLLLNYSSPASGPAAPLHATLKNPPAASAKAEAAPAAVADAIASPQRESLPEPAERTYPKSAPAAHQEPAGESTPPGESAAVAAPGDTANAPSTESSALPAPPRPAIDLNGLRQYHAALNRVAARFRRYPAQAREAGWEGMVAMRLSVSDAGVPVGLELIGSSGYPVLDRAALEMMHLAATHTPVPESLRGRAFTIDLGAGYNIKDEY